jgi:hypothetical protein
MRGSWQRCCNAWSKHTAARKAGKLRGLSPFCRKWAIPGKTRCYLHGGRSTGPRTPEGKARSLAAAREGRAVRILHLHLAGKKIATGHNGGRYPNDTPPEMRHRSPKPSSHQLSSQQQLKNLRTALAAQQQEVDLRRQLLSAIFRGADAALVRNPRDPAKRQDLSARANAAATTLRQKWWGPK